MQCTKIICSINNMPIFALWELWSANLPIVKFDIVGMFRILASVCALAFLFNNISPV